MYNSSPYLNVKAKVAELVDALDLGSSGATRGSSSLPFRTTYPPRVGYKKTVGSASSEPIPEELVETADTDAVEVSVEVQKGLERRITVRVPAVEIEQEVDTRLKKVGQTARLKGFRPGKIPAKVVRQRYGGQVREEVMTDVIRTSYSRALAQEELNPAGGPSIEPLPTESEEHFSYRATFEVYPEVQLKPTDTIKLETPRVEFDASDVDEMVEMLDQMLFDENLRHYADQRITLDLDDGVKVNYGKFGDLLAEVKAVTGKK